MRLTGHSSINFDISYEFWNSFGVTLMCTIYLVYLATHNSMGTVGFVGPSHRTDRETDYLPVLHPPCGPSFNHGSQKSDPPSLSHTTTTKLWTVRTRHSHSFLTDKPGDLDFLCFVWSFSSSFVVVVIVVLVCWRITNSPFHYFPLLLHNLPTTNNKQRTTKRFHSTRLLPRNKNYPSTSSRRCSTLVS